MSIWTIACDQPTQYELHFDGINVHYGDVHVLTISLTGSVIGSAVGDTVTFTPGAISGSWNLNQATYQISTGLITMLYFQYASDVFWQYPNNNLIVCKKYEGEFPVLGAQTLAVNDAADLPLWYDEAGFYDTTPGVPGCDNGSNTVRTSSGLIYVTSITNCTC